VSGTTYGASKACTGKGIAAESVDFSKHSTLEDAHNKNGKTQWCLLFEGIPILLSQT